MSATLQLLPPALKPNCLVRALDQEKDYLPGNRLPALGSLLILALVA